MRPAKWNRLALREFSGTICGRLYTYDKIPGCMYIGGKSIHFSTGYRNLKVFSRQVVQPKL